MCEFQLGDPFTPWMDVDPVSQGRLATQAAGSPALDLGVRGCSGGGTGQNLQRLSRDRAVYTRSPTGTRPLRGPDHRGLRNAASRAWRSRRASLFGTAGRGGGRPDRAASREARRGGDFRRSRKGSRIDVVMAFIRRTGIAPMLEALRAHRAAEGEMRVLTTTYTGSTEARALDELRELGAGCSGLLRSQRDPPSRQGLALPPSFGVLHGVHRVVERSTSIRLQPRRHRSRAPPSRFLTSSSRSPAPSPTSRA